MSCIGQCCDQFNIFSGPDWSGRRLRDWMVEHDVSVTHPHFIRIRQILIPVIGQDDRFACNEFDPVTRKCRAYADRPDVCKRFPYDHRCSYCGASTDAEARGVALMVPATPIE